MSPATITRGTRTASRGTRTSARWVDLPRDGAEHRATPQGPEDHLQNGPEAVESGASGVDRSSATSRGGHHHRAVGRPTARGSEYRASGWEHRATRVAQERIEQGEHD